MGEPETMGALRIDIDGVAFAVVIETEPVLDDLEERQPGQFESGDYLIELKQDRARDHELLARVSVRRRDGSPFMLRAFDFRVDFPVVDLHRIFLLSQIDVLGQVSRESYAWWVSETVSASHGAPLVAALNRVGENRLFMAFIDQKRDTLISHRNLHYLYEHDIERSRYSLRRPLTDGAIKTQHYEEELYISLRAEPWDAALRRFVEVHDQRTEPAIPSLPDRVTHPVWNGWYGYGREATTQADIEDSIAATTRLGMKSMIIDGAWYAPDGDWFARTGDHQVYAAKYPDLKGLADKIHAADLNAILWCMPHMIGNEARARDELGHLLFQPAHADVRSTDLRQPWTFLCPRVTDTQDHLASVVDVLMRTYDLDGLKIDFIDNSGTLIDECVAPHVHAYATMGEGMDACLRRMREAIAAVRPDPFIEFRVNYANINNRPYGNCFRAVDCPYDYDQNRRLCTLLKPIARGVAVHSDPAYWHPAESVANISRYLSSMIFCGSVPTFSVDVRSLRPEEERLIQAWLGFFEAYREDLLFGDFTPLSLDAHFSENRIVGAHRAFLGFFLPEGNRACVEIPRPVEEVFVANGTNVPRLRCEIGGIGDLREVTIFDPFLSKIRQSTIERTGGGARIDVEVPCGGLVRLA